MDGDVGDRAGCVVGGVGNRELQAAGVAVGLCSVRGPDRAPQTLLEVSDVRLIRWTLCGRSAGHGGCHHADGPTGEAVLWTDAEAVGPAPPLPEQAGAVLREEIERARRALRKAGREVHDTEVVDVPRARRILPESWGFVEVLDHGGEPVLYTLREARRARRQDPGTLSSVLSRTSAENLLGKHGLARGYRGKPRWMLRRRAAEKLRPNVLKAAVRNEIRNHPHRRVH